MILCGICIKYMLRTSYEWYCAVYALNICYVHHMNDIVRYMHQIYMLRTSYEWYYVRYMHKIYATYITWMILCGICIKYMLRTSYEWYCAVYASNICCVHHMNDIVRYNMYTFLNTQHLICLSNQMLLSPFKQRCTLYVYAADTSISELYPLISSVSRSIIADLKSRRQCF